MFLKMAYWETFFFSFFFVADFAHSTLRTIDQVELSPLLSVVYAVKILNIILWGVLFSPLHRGLDEIFHPFR